MELQISLFAHLDLALDNQPFPQKLRPRAGRLLSFLLLNRDRALLRESAAFNLWPDTSEANALSTLRRALNEIQTVLPKYKGRDWILSSQGRLQWNPQTNAWLDVDEYEKLARQETAKALDSATNLYKGDLLIDFDEAWVIIERERLRQLQCGLLWKLTSHYRSHNLFKPALECITRLIQYDPLSELVHREFMTLHYLNGDRANALSVFEKLKDSLARELDVNPMEETIALRDLILRGEPPPNIITHDLSSIAIPGTPEEIHLIGRQMEMVELTNAWEDAAQGHGRQVIVSGPAGIGKTHLMKTFAGYVSKRGGKVLLGQCHDFGKSVPFLALRTALLAIHSDLEKLQLEPKQITALSKIVPEIAFRPKSIDESLWEAARDSGTFPELLESILQVFLLLSHRQPVLLIVEDAHWASHATLDWMNYASGYLHDNSVLIIVTYRKDEIDNDYKLGRLQSRLVWGNKSLPLMLKPLSKTEHLELVCCLSGLSQVQAEPLSARLYLETEGNPFFLEELVRGLIECGEIIQQAEVWSGPFVENASNTHIILPESLIESINLRVDRLSKEGKEFIQAAAVMGREFKYEVIHQAVDWSEAATLSALDETVIRQFIVEEKDEDNSSLSFTHHLVRDAILARMPAPKRIHWHRRIATAIKDLNLDTMERYGDLAYHYYHGQVWQDAALYAIRSGDQMVLTYNDDEALQYYEQALHALSHLGSNPIQKFDVVTRRLKIEERLGEYEKITNSLAELENLARLSEDPLLLARALLARGRFLRLVGPIPQAREILNECIQLCERFDQPELQALALVEISQADFVLISNQDALIEMERALDIYRRGKFLSEAEQKLQYAIALRVQGAMYGRMGRLQESLDLLEESLAIQRETNTPRLDEIAFTQLEQGWAYQAIGELSHHLPILEEAVNTLRKIDFRGALVGAHLLEMAIHLGVQKKPMDEAREILPQLNRWQSRSDIKGMRLGMLAWYEMVNGNPQKALPDAEMGLALFRKSGNLSEILLLLPILSLIHLELGNVEAALAASQEGLGLLADNQHFSQTTLNFAHYRALQAAGCSQEAKPYLQRSYEALKTRADALQDPELRQACYTLPFNTQIVTAWEQIQG